MGSPQILPKDGTPRKNIENEQELAEWRKCVPGGENRGVTGVNTQAARASHLRVAKETHVGRPEATVTPARQGSSACERAPLTDHHAGHHGVGSQGVVSRSDLLIRDPPKGIPSEHAKGGGRRECGEIYPRPEERIK